MTYILGLNYLGINSIISDARVTSGSGEGYNTSLKTGLLFPGCMFGRAGNVAASRDFILAVKGALPTSDTLPSLWKQFEEFITFYDMPRAETNAGGRFQVLLSSRCMGKPELYLLDSFNRKLSPVKGDWVSVGSGKIALDPLVRQHYKHTIGEITKIIQIYPVPKQIYPHFICLWLSELTLTFEKSALEKIGVGGAFHFVYQTDNLETMQNPALYVFCDANIAAKQITCWFYRVCFVQGCLVVEQVIPPHQLTDVPLGKHERQAFCDEASRPDIMDRMVNDPEFKEKMKQELNALPFYQFCGFGFTNPAFRRGFGFHFTNEGKYVVAPDGEIADEYKALIVSHFQ